MKRIKIAKYTREKHKKAWDTYHAEQARIRYKTGENMRYLLGELWRCHPVMFLVLVLELFAAAANGPLGTYTSKYVVELALVGEDWVRTGLICLGLIVGERLTKYLWNQCSSYRSYTGNYRFLCHMSRKLMRRAMSTDYENHERCAQSDALQKATTGAGYIVPMTMETVLYFLLAVTQVLAYGTILSMLSPIMLLLVALPSAASYYIERHKNMWIWNMADNWQQYERELNYVRQAAGDFQKAKDVRLYGMDRWLGQIFTRSFCHRQDWNAQQDEWSFRHDLFRVVLIHLTNLAAYAYVIALVIRGNIGPGDFVLYFGSIYQLSFSVRNVFDKYSGFNWLSNNLSYAREYLDIPDRTNRGEGAPLPTAGCEIEFRDVGYTYAGAPSPTLQHLSFTLHKGEKLAIVGLNGAGKTTLIKLLCGLYLPTEGEILLNGRPVNDYNRESYFTLFSTVFQDIAVLPVTIAENIAGVRGDAIDLSRVAACLQQAGLYEDVMRLPQGIHTRLVKSVYDDATELSGGQMQKLALARALYRDGAVLLLDEPTAALDPIAERDLYQSYAHFSAGKSCVFISHRLASTRFCDRILLLEHGHIAEQGSHQDLMEQGSTYARLFALQSSYYQDAEVQQHDKES